MRNLQEKHETLVTVLRIVCVVISVTVHIFKYPNVVSCKCSKNSTHSTRFHIKIMLYRLNYIVKCCAF